LRIPKERENHLGFEDPEEKGSQISKKLKGFGGEDPKLPREPLAATRDGMEEKKRGPPSFPHLHPARPILPCHLK
jgi:hypothetical protein